MMQSKTTAATPTESKEASRVSYAAGDVIFRRGDSGGDLFFIEDGEVEIYNEKEGQVATLTTMRTGEIIGVMTCLTNEPRMASARAKTVVSVKKISQEAIKRSINNMPPWLNIVLKEFGIRLKQVNDQVLDAANKIKKLESNAITKLYTATQLTGVLANSGDYFCRKLDEGKVLFIEEIMDKLALMLNRPIEELDAIMQVLQDSGIIRIEVEPERKRKYFTYENAAALSYFPQFVRDTKSGPKRRLIRTKFANKEFRLIMNIVKYTRKRQGDDGKVAKVLCKDLEQHLEKATNCAFEPDVLKQAIELELIKYEGSGEQKALVFAPITLARTMTCIEAIRRLNILESTGPRPEEKNTEADSKKSEKAA